MVPPLTLNRLSGTNSPDSSGGAPSICLCMIVKNEASIIRRCLASVLGHLSHWCIVDTGSMDGTQDIVREYMKGVPGSLHERPWVDFATARNDAMALASNSGCDFLMIIDADEELECGPINKPILVDVVQAEVRTKHGKEPRVWLVRNGYKGRWIGSIHEDLEPFGVWAMAKGPFIKSHDDGARFKDPARVNNDLRVLFEEIKKDPKNPRNYYYLGATYLAAGDVEQAAKAFSFRLKMQGGNPREIELSKEALTYILEAKP